MKLLLNIVLSVVIVVLVVILCLSIKAPIDFNNEKERRYQLVEERLELIKKAQFAYKELNRKFADHFESLIHTIKKDSFMLIKTIGNPDDTAQIITRDTVYILVINSLFPGRQEIIDDLPYLPCGNHARFNINAGEVTKGKVKVNVFEVSTSNEDILYGMDERFYNKGHKFTLGSMFEPNYVINKPR